MCSSWRRFYNYFQVFFLFPLVILNMDRGAVTMRVNNNKTDHHRGWRFGIWLGLVLTSVSAPGAETGLGLTTNPAQIPLCHINQPVHALLMLQNTTANLLSHVCIKSLTNGPIQVAITGFAATVAKNSNCPDGIYLAEINSNASMVRPMTVTITKVPLITPQVVMWADYQSRVADKVIHTSSPLELNLLVGTVPTQDNIKLSTSTSFTSLQENATGKV